MNLIVKDIKKTSNRRNEYSPKKVKTSRGELAIDIPRDRDASFEAQIVSMRTRDVSDIENKVISMYSKGMSQRDISFTIEDIYGILFFVKWFPI